MKGKKSELSENLYWIFTLFGTAVGAGVLFLPIQAGISGLFWVIVLTLCLFPIINISHKLFADLLLKSKQPRDFTASIVHFLGPGFGLIINVLYFLLMFLLLLVYSIGLNNDLGHFLFEKGIFSENPCNSPFFSLIVISIFFLSLKFTKKFIIKIAGTLSVVLIVMLFGISLSLIGHWDFSSLSLLSKPKISLDHLLLFFPVLIPAFLFYPSMSSMITGFRETASQPQEVADRIYFIVKITSLALIVFIMFFIFSCMFAIPYQDFKKGIHENISTLTLLSELHQNAFLSTTEPLISIFAMATSFFGIGLGLRESGMGLVKSSEKYLFITRKLSASKAESIVYLSSGLFLWIFTIINFSVLQILGEFIAPLSAFFLFLLPAYILLKGKGISISIKQRSVFIGFIGILLLFSYYIGKLI